MSDGSGRVLSLRVVEVVAETADARSIVLEPVDGGETIDYRPGQFLTVRIPTDRPTGAARCYSLSSCPVVGEPLRITVKRTAGGYASKWLCDNVAPGSTLDVLRPSGTFTPRSLDGRLLMFAAGSGITPVMSIIKSVLHAGAGSVLLCYANRDERSVIFAAELAELVARFPGRFAAIHWLESVQGLPRRESLALIATGWSDATAYLCGPEPFMATVAAALESAGIPGRRVHRERYHSLETDPFTGPGPRLPRPAGAGDATKVTVTLDGRTTGHSWPRTELLLDTLLADGLDVPYSCREGKCSACACRVLSGEVAMDHNEILDQSELDDGYILACQSRPLSDEVQVGYDC